MESLSFFIFRKLTICDKLNIPYPPPLLLSFNPVQYTSIGNNNLKEASFDKTDKSRESYLDSILENINSADVRTLIKYLEEKSQLGKFTKAFPTKRTHQYFQFMDYLSYNDKLLDAFEERFGDNIQEAVEFVESYCRNNSHI